MTLYNFYELDKSLKKIYYHAASFSLCEEFLLSPLKDEKVPFLIKSLERYCSPLTTIGLICNHPKCLGLSLSELTRRLKETYEFADKDDKNSEFYADCFEYVFTTTKLEFENFVRLLKIFFKDDFTHLNLISLTLFMSINPLLKERFLSNRNLINKEEFIELVNHYNSSIGYNYIECKKHLNDNKELDA